MNQFHPSVHPQFQPIQTYQQVNHPPFYSYQPNQKPFQKQNQQAPRSQFEIEEADGLQKFMKSEMNFKFQQMITYEQLLNQYDRILAFDLKDQRLLMQQVILMEIQMQPQNMFWIFWRNSDEILEFLQDIQHQITLINTVKELLLDTGKTIVSQYHQLIKDWRKMNQNEKNKLYGAMQMGLVQKLIEWLHLVGHHSYLRKSAEFLIFVSHCLPLDRCNYFHNEGNMQIYQQMYIHKKFNILDKVVNLVSDEKKKRKNDYFLTITSDGIIKSDNHLLYSKVQSMIPFTNLMKVKQVRIDGDIIYYINSGKSEAWEINFHENYVDAINFACGFGRARIDAYYKAPYKQNLTSYNRQDYIEEEKQNTVFHRFQSFAPPRTNCSVKMYNDGCGYFEDMYGCMMNAKFQICITDWMLTPYFLLRRPGTIGQKNIENRLDGVLFQAAQRGVKVFIILFMEPAMFLNSDSEGAAKALEKMHKNIKVMRHPNLAVPIIWSHHEKLCVIDQKIGFMGGLDICYGRWDTPEHKLVEKVTDPNKRLWDGCDYNNFRTSDIYQPRKYETSNLNQDFQVRMPWHDIALQMRGDCVIDLLRHFVQYWYFVKSEYKFSPSRFFKSFQKRDKTIKKRHCGKHIKETTEEYLEQKWELFIEDVNDEFFPGNETRVSEMLIEQRTGVNAGNTNIQMLRSANNWSIGADPDHPEKSIHQAYKDLIKNAESHIYIENQFFMGLKNEIVKTLCERVIRAWNQKKPFKVIVVVPLLPGFEGDPGDENATVLRIQIHWQKVAILTGDDSIYKTLQTNCPGIKVQDYLFFFGLRTWDILHGSAITEIIYVHSKLMIVDDKRAICGSANINDRSLSGEGDSEIAVCIEETDLSGNHLFDLRCRIYDQHFKLTNDECAKITTPAVWNKLLQRAKTNTIIYREVFGCIPDDQVTTHQEIEMQSAKATYNTSKLKQIVGHAVEYPLKFMDDQDLEFTVGQKEYYAPVQSFT